MKKYLMFSYSDHYPMGGWNDYVRSFHSLADARERISLYDVGSTIMEIDSDKLGKLTDSNIDVVDIDAGVIVLRFGWEGAGYVDKVLDWDDEWVRPSIIEKRNARRNRG